MSWFDLSPKSKQKREGKNLIYLLEEEKKIEKKINK